MVYTDIVAFPRSIKDISLSPLYTVASALPRPLLEHIYVTYVRPHFDYCDAIFDGHITAHDEHRLETLQNMRQDLSPEQNSEPRQTNQA